MIKWSEGDPDDYDLHGIDEKGHCWDVVYGNYGWVVYDRWRDRYIYDGSEWIKTTISRTISSATRDQDKLFAETFK